VKNLKSQISSLRKPDANREAELKDQIGAGEARVAELKREILVRERGRIDGEELRKTMEPFEALWKTMNIQEQSLLLRQLVEKVGFDGRTIVTAGQLNVQAPQVPSPATSACRASATRRYSRRR
jgi:hypothetical protein